MDSADNAESVNDTVNLFVNLIQTVVNTATTPKDLWVCLQTLTLPLLGDTPLCSLWDSGKPVLEIKDNFWIWQVGGIFGMTEIDYSCGIRRLLYGDS